MSLPINILLLAFLIGIATGLRSMTPIAVTTWFAYLGRIGLRQTPLSFLASLPAAAIFTIAAVGELVVDKLPKTPARTGATGLAARFVMGGLCGAAVALASAQLGWAVGAVLGAIGGIVGAFAGYQARTRLVKVLKVPDIVIAIAEDVVAIGASIVILSLA
jgi:uncharacterized membrane protein